MKKQTAPDTAIGINSIEDRKLYMGRVLLASAAAMMFFMAAHSVQGCCQVLSGIELLLSISMAVLYWLLHRDMAIERIEDGLAACAFILFLALLTTESLENTGPFWVAGYPFVLYFIKPLRYARFWVGAFLAGMLLALALESAGMISLSVTSVQLACLISVVAFFWMLAHIYQSLFETRQSELQASYRSIDRQQRQLQAILDHAPNGIWMLNSERQIQFMNRTWVKRSGISEETAKSTDDYSTLLPPEAAKESLARDAECLSGDSPLYSRQSLECDDGVTRTFDTIRVRVNNRDGEARGLVGFAIDISERLHADMERQKLEQQIQHGQRLESLGIMAGGVAHDFNNVLMAIIGNVELAKLDEDLNDSTLEFLDSIDMASQAAADLCQQLLAYSGQGMLEPVDMDIASLVDDMSSLMQASAGKHVSLEVNHASGLPLIHADRGQMRQVILNILMNAAESIGGETAGKIVINSRAKQLKKPLLMLHAQKGGLPKGQYVVLEITDNGCGMSNETLERVFDPFFSTKFTGRGLGMSAVLGIIRAHGGGLQIVTAEGEGTTMSIWLPALAESTIPVEPVELFANEDISIEAGVLVVDDEPAVLRVAKRMLERMGCKVLTATNGNEALEVFASHMDEIDWVLLDMTMPVMDGLACLKELRKVRPEVLVALSTGYNQESLSEENDMQDAFLKKPYSYAAMQELAEQMSLSKSEPG